MSDDQSLDEIIELVKEYMENYLVAKDGLDEAQSEFDVAKSELLEMKGLLLTKADEEKDRVAEVLKKTEECL